MDIIEIQVVKGVQHVRDEMEQMLDEMCQLTRAFVPRRTACWAPPTDIYETHQEIIVLVEMAGLKKEEIQVVMDQGLLMISGQRLNPIQEPSRQVHRMGIDFGPFERKIRIAVAVDLDGIQAVYQEGFLVIRIPKAEPAQQEIKVSKQQLR